MVDKGTRDMTTLLGVAPEMYLAQVQSILQMKAHHYFFRLVM